MKSEIKTCQNCKKDFTIEPEDFNFYEKINVPPPTFCPECRMVRRLT
ncbi:MAG: cytochrome C551 [Candidatus Paceibacterota bacterium]